MDTKDDKQDSFGYWERRAVEQDAELHKGIKKPENKILIAYFQAQEYLKAEAKNIYDRYSAQPGMNEDMMHDLLNAKMASNDLSDLIAMLKVTKDKQVRKQIQRYLNAMAAKARITRLEMLRAKAYVVAKQLADVQLRQETDFLSKAVQASYKQAAVEAIIGQANHDVQVKAPRSFPGASKLPNVIEFNDPDTGEAIKTIELHPDKPTKVFKQLSTSQTRAVLNIKWVGGNYSSRIWKNTDHLADRLGELFTAQQMSGMSERDMIAALQKEFQVGAYVARRLIRTEANFVAGQAKLMGWRAHGVKQYVLIAVLDWRTSTICREKDGQVFNVADAHCDGAKGNYPPFHSFCRTVAAAYFGKDTFVGKHDYNNPLGHAIALPAGTTWHEWEQALIDKYGEEAVRESQQKASNQATDSELFDRYKALMTDDMPETFDDFQTMKYNGDRDWQLLQLDYERRMRLTRDSSLGLPNASMATSDTRKFTSYLFGGSNEKGLEKGQNFTRVLGYDADNWKDLKKVLLENSSQFPAKKTRMNGDGSEGWMQNQVVRGVNGQLANVKTAWASKDGKTWLVTAFIEGAKEEV
ncbi:minor capsid protein [Lacticaseibacillus yichunensis]|uniref:Minor capsid protein n=2 Tax=Bacilli TaxID=91061 RepID=A0ABW4CK72_9LACO|nr:minor capsid protein [Lacticaseibacillus yichunensis]